MMHYDVYWLDGHGFVHVETIYADSYENSSHSVFNKYVAEFVMGRILKVEITNWDA